MTFDLETDRDLVALLAAQLRAHEFNLVDIAQQAEDVGAPEVAGRLHQALGDIAQIRVIPTVMTSRAGGSFRAPAAPHSMREERTNTHGQVSRPPRRLVAEVADLGRKEHLVTIESIQEEEVGDDRKLVARFEGKAKGLVLNDTKNLETLETAFGPDSEDAIGGQVILFVDPDVRYGGQRVGGVRLKLPKKVTPKEKAASKQTTAEIIGDEITDANW